MFLRTLLVLSVLATQALAAGSQLPDWFPAQLFTINPDNLTIEDFGSQEFKVGKTDDPQTIELKGHHWSGSLYPPGPAESWDHWDGPAVWAKIRPLLEKQGFQLVFSRGDSDLIDATLRKGSGASASMIELTLTKDAYSNSVAIIEPSTQTRALTLVPPARQPEKFGDRDDFPYLAPLSGAKQLDTRHDDGPLDVATQHDEEPHFVGTGTLTKLYQGPPNVNPLDFSATYQTALEKAGWSIADVNGGAVLAHFDRNGRELWAKLFQEGADRWDITVTDIGQDLRSALSRQCKVAIYGLEFDFNKATLRPDSKPVLEQVAAAIKSSSVTSLEIAGHTDNVGAHEYNQKLSEQRAKAVRDWLVQHGIEASRLTARGFGESQPLVANDSPAHRARNRRVELKKPGCEG